MASPTSLTLALTFSESWSTVGPGKEDSGERGLTESNRARRRLSVLMSLIASLSAPFIPAMTGAATVAHAKGSAHSPVLAAPSRHRPAGTERNPSATSGRTAQPSIATTSLPAVGGSWTSLGPRPIADTPNANAFLYGNVAGRTTAIAVDPTNPLVVYLGTAGGGVWKSTDGGANWVAKSDNQATGGIGALAIDPSNHLVIYAGTGEDNACNDICPFSRGVLKSIDGGATWTLLAAATFSPSPPVFTWFDWLTVDRANGQHVLAGTSRGLFASTDGGTTWIRNTQVLGVTTVYQGTTASGSTDVVLQDPDTASTWYAAVADQCLTEAGQVMKSIDNGATWAESTHFNFGSGSFGIERIGLGVGHGGVLYASPSDCDFAHRSALDSGGWKGTGGGASWAPMSSPIDWFDPPSSGGGQGFYDNIVAVDPNNANHAAFGGITIAVTNDGGSTFADVGHVYTYSGPEGPLHPDFHALAFNGTLDHLFAGNDGGVYFTGNLGGAGLVTDWTNLNATLQLTTYYHGDALDLNHLAGGAQDDGTSAIYPGQTPSPPAFGMLDGGDGGWTAFDTTANSTMVYTEAQLGKIHLADYSLVNSTTPYINPAGPCYSDATPLAPVGPACADTNIPFVTPFVMDPTNPSRLYMAGGVFYRTTTGGRVPADGTSWVSIGGPTLQASPKDSFTTMAIDPTGAQIVAATHFGHVYQSLNANAATPGNVAWTEITGNLPVRSAATRIPNTDWFGSAVISPTSSSELWISIGGSDNVGRVYHTLNGGVTWTDISGSSSTALPPGVTHALTANPDPSDPTLYAGTDAGAFVCSACAGSSPTPAWVPLGNGLPNVRIQQLEVTHDQKNLVAFTHGRGAWALSLPVGPAVTSVAPTSGPPAGGTPVVVTGIHFTGATGVSFGANPATSFSVVNDTTINATSPAGVVGAIDVTVAGPGGTSAVNAGDHFTYAVAPSTTVFTGVSTQQYTLTGNDGSTWVTMDATNLQATVTPSAGSTAVLGANADLFTNSSGYNQDIAIFVSDNGGADQLVAWKESGGFAGIFSPNAAFVQSAYSMTAGHTYVFKMKWKTNKPEPGGVIIYAAAGGGAPFSPTRITAEVIPAGASLSTGVSTQQYTLTGNDGSTWATMDATNLQTTVSPSVSSTVMLGANADLFTNSTGYNQDIAIFVSDNGGADQLVAWKESGGFAGIFSPNAAFVQSAYSMTAGHTYVFKMKWKTNKPEPGGVIIYAAAGGGAPFSPSRITAEVVPAGASLSTGVSAQQYTLTGNDGSTWATMDATNLQTTVSPSAVGKVILGVNGDLFTDSGGYNQDIAIFVSDNGGADQLVAWKESGGFAGIYSPNAAFVQSVYNVIAGHTYVFKLKWKTNKPEPGGVIIYAAAGAGAPFSPTRISAELTN